MARWSPPSNAVPAALLVTRNKNLHAGRYHFLGAGKRDAARLDNRWTMSAGASDTRARRSRRVILPAKDIGGQDRRPRPPTPLAAESPWVSPSLRRNRLRAATSPAAMRSNFLRCSVYRCSLLVHQRFGGSCLGCAVTAAFSWRRRARRDLPTATLAKHASKSTPLRSRWKTSSATATAWSSEAQRATSLEGDSPVTTVARCQAAPSTRTFAAAAM
jgi:hypothetical protein